MDYKQKIATNERLKKLDNLLFLEGVFKMRCNLCGELLVNIPHADHHTLLHHS